MASVDDVNSTLKGIVTNLSKLASFVTLPGSLTTTLSPAATNITALGTTSLQVIGSSTLRRGIAFSNPGSQNVWIVPNNVAASSTQGILLIPGSLYEVPVWLGASAGWNALAATGSANTLTVIEFF